MELRQEYAWYEGFADGCEGHGRSRRCFRRSTGTKIRNLSAKIKKFRSFGIGRNDEVYLHARELTDVLRRVISSCGSRPRVGERSDI